MSVFRSRLFLGSFLGAIAIAGCDGNNNTGDASDVTDAATDIARDMGSDTATDTGSDTGPADTGEDTGADIVTPTDTVDVADASDDVPTDAPTCPTDPLPYSVYSVISPFGNRINMQHGDATGIGGPEYITGRAEIFAELDTPIATVGACSQFNGHNPARGTASIDYGTLTLTQGSSSAMFQYDTTMGAYIGMGFNMFNFMPGMPVTMSMPMNDAGAAQMVTLTAPPVPAVGASPFMAAFTDPAGTMTISGTTDNTVTWTPVNDPNLTAAFILVDSANVLQNAIVCGAPACSGQITIPASMIARFASGTVLQVQLGMWSIAPVPPTGRTPAANVGIGASTAYLVTTN